MEVEQGEKVMVEVEDWDWVEWAMEGEGGWDLEEKEAGEGVRGE